MKCFSFSAFIQIIRNSCRHQYNLFLLIIGLFIMFSCSDRTRVDGNVEVIPIDFDKFEKVDMRDVFSKIEVVILEGGLDSYIKWPEELFVYNGYYYILDDNTIYVFDSLGNYCYNTKNRRGRGPNEYFALNGHYIVDEDICIMENDGTILKYDSLLNLKEKYSVPLKGSYFYSEIMPLSDDILALNGPNSDKDSTFWNFYSISKNKIVGSCCMPEFLDGAIFAFGGLKKYLCNDKQVLYRPKDNGYSLYRLNKDDYSVTKAYRYDVGDDAFDASEVDESQTISSFLLENYQKYIILMDLKLNNRYLVSRIGYIAYNGLMKGNMRLSFYSLEDGKQRLIDHLFVGDKCLLSIDYLDDSAIYTITNHCDDVEYLYDDSLIDEDSRNRLKNVNDDSNALIFKYYLRDDIL